MIQNERELEDYICEHQEEFIEELKNIYGEDEDIKFLGRQVRIGENNIADLIYYYDIKDGKAPVIIKNYIIIELKFRKLEPKDLAQISRYISCLSEKLQSEDKYLEYENSVCGLFVSFGLDNLMQEISIGMDLENIEFLSLKTDITLQRENWSHKQEFIEKLKLDDRIEQLYREV